MKTQENDGFTLDTHCYVCHKQTTHEVIYRVSNRTVMLVVHCPVCKAVSKCDLSIKSLAYATVKRQWGPA